MLKIAEADTNQDYDDSPNRQINHYNNNNTIPLHIYNVSKRIMC